jgi:hypothetical protein
LLGDVQLCCVEVDQFPGKAKNLALAQAQDQDQYISRIQRLIVAAGRFEELSRIVDTPPVPLALARGGQPDDGRDVARDLPELPGAPGGLVPALT